MSPLDHLAALNAAPLATAMTLIGEVAENTPWVAERALAARPFARPIDVWTAVTSAIAAATSAEQLALIRAHPELAGREAAEGTMTAASTTEQGRLGLDRLSPADAGRLADLNRRYRETFGIPCIIALKLHDSLASVIAAFESRLRNAPDAEHAAALAQIGHIIRARLARTFAMQSGRLSTHVLDTATGAPAAGMALALLAADGTGWREVLATTTNSQGRTDAPLLTDLAMAPGQYLIEFQAGDYFRARGVALADPPFLDVIPLRFAISDCSAHYHVPLLCSPWSYTTYRGS